MLVRSVVQHAARGLFSVENVARLCVFVKMRWARGSLLTANSELLILCLTYHVRRSTGFVVWTVFGSVFRLILLSAALALSGRGTRMATGAVPRYILEGKCLGVDSSSQLHILS